ncbi:MAG: hypothetical protein O7F76_07130 [Planctomycetota bacterium]|nr:hypothetical protein [Planctomycetota bacterium]
MTITQRNHDRRTRFTPLVLLFFLPLLTGCNVGFFVSTYIAGVVAIETITIPARSILGTIVLQVINSI